MISEDQLEQICLEWFREGGYEYAFVPDIAHDGETPERVDYRQVVPADRLLSAIQKINPHIPLAVLEDAALFVAKAESPVLIHNKRTFHRLLLEGVEALGLSPDEIAFYDALAKNESAVWELGTRYFKRLPMS